MNYVLYHADCRDGFGSAFAAWKSLGDGATYLACQHGTPPPDLLVDRTTRIFVVDFSFPRSLLLRWHEEAAEVLVIDHHVTAQENLAGLPFASFDMDRSAALMVWEHFHPDRAAPAFLRHVQDMDLWRFELPDTRQVCAAIDSYPQDFRVWDGFCDDGAVARLRDEGRIIGRFVEQQVAYLCRQAMRLDLAEFKGVPAVCSPLFISETCAKLLELNPDAPLATAWFQVEPDRRIFSLRSRQGGTDVARLATRYGGGGHPSASGFSVPVGSVDLAPPAGETKA